MVCGALSSAVGWCAGLEKSGSTHSSAGGGGWGQAALAWGTLQLRTQAGFASRRPAGVSEAAIPKAPGSLVPPLLCLQRRLPGLPASAKSAGPAEPTWPAGQSEGSRTGQALAPSSGRGVRSVPRPAGAASDPEARHGTWLERLPVRPQGPSSGLTARGSCHPQPLAGSWVHHLN